MSRHRKTAELIETAALKWERGIFPLRTANCENPISASSSLLSPRSSSASSMNASRIGAAARTPPNTASGLRSCELNH